MLKSLFQLFFPKHCACCQSYLENSEVEICASCLAKAPIRSENLHHTFLKEHLACFFNIADAYSLLFFREQQFTSKVIHQLKYYNKPNIGFVLGKLVGERLPANFDYLIPIPLHPKKLKKRGYNQAEQIAKGIQNQLNIPIETKRLIRIVNNPQQALNTNTEARLKNVLNIFSLQEADFFEGKHILIIDDVITSGSTIYQATYPFLQIKNCTISIVCISYAG